MTTISTSKLYDLLSPKIGREEAESLVTYVESKIKAEFETNAKGLVTKEDLAREISRLELKVSESKSEMIKWMFIFWIGQIAATFGFILLFLKK